MRILRHVNPKVCSILIGTMGGKIILQLWLKLHMSGERLCEVSFP
jgi:hypothetical protein